MLPRIRSRVVFPEPLRPMIPNISPFSISNEIPSRTRSVLVLACFNGCMRRLRAPSVSVPRAGRVKYLRRFSTSIARGAQGVDMRLRIEQGLASLSVGNEERGGEAGGVVG